MDKREELLTSNINDIIQQMTVILKAENIIEICGEIVMDINDEDNEEDWKDNEIFW